MENILNKIGEIIKKQYPNMPTHKFNHIINKIKLMNYNDLMLEEEEIIYPPLHKEFWKESKIPNWLAGNF